MRPSPTLQIFLAAVAICIVFVISFNQNYAIPVWFQSTGNEHRLPVHRARLDNEQNAKPNSAECHIPDYDPYDNEILHLVKTPEKITCLSPAQLLLVNEAKVWTFNPTVLRMLRLKPSEVRCSYETVTRNGDREIHRSDTVPFSPPYKITANIFTIKCIDVSSRMLFQKVFTQILPIKQDTYGSSKSNQYSVLVFGVDSMSRLNFLRRLPSTYGFLKGDLRGFDFKSYTKVGENTYPNVLAMLTGVYPDARHHLPDFAAPADKLPLIWSRFKKTGYVTMFAEDCPDIGAFNLMKTGFDGIPTDYYYRPYELAKKHIQLFAAELKPKDKNDSSDYKNAFDRNNRLCYGETYDHMTLVEYYTKFLDMHSRAKRFSFSWLSLLSHSSLNNIQIADQNFTDFLRYLHVNGHLKSSFLFFISDHGGRFGDIKMTNVGSFEANMPFSTVVVPHNFQSEYPNITDILKENTKRLVTPYDIYETLHDILLARYGNVRANRSGLGISLFKTIPRNRTCAEAHIPEQFCTCFKSRFVSTNATLVKRISKFIVNLVNNITESKKTKCSRLVLQNIMKAEIKELGFNQDLVYPENEETSITTSGHYLVSVETAPSNAWFEASVSYNQPQNTFKLLGQVIRTNMYGTQSRCVQSSTLKPYCFCLASNGQ